MPEELIVGAYGVAALALFVAYGDLIWRVATRWVLLVAAAAFAISIGIDLVDPRDAFSVHEDLAKLIGIFNWTVGWSVAAVAVVRRERSELATEH